MRASSAKAAAEIERLRREIREHDRKYYLENDPSVADEEYDRLMARLAALEEEHPELRAPDSPTRRVGGGVSTAFAPVVHSVPMLSLDNTYNEDEVRAWHERVVKGLGHPPSMGYLVEAKIDGISCSLTYTKGRLSQAATRGSGEIGEDVTQNALRIGPIPKKLSTDLALVEIRGEIFLRIDSFNRINDALKKEGKEPFVNPRNCASGSLRQKDPGVTEKRNLHFLAHSFGRIEGARLESHSEFLDFCKKTLGIPVNDQRKLCGSIDQVVDFYNAFKARQEKKPLPYEVDGLVVKVNSFAEQKRLGFTARSPRWAIAFKYPGRQATTTIEGVTFSVGRTGTITPVAELKPVFLAGVTISSASLHNFEEIERLGVRVGDVVTIERAGEVIPKVVKVAESRGGAPIRPPSACPVCKDPVEREEGFVAWRCANPSCPAQLKRSLLHFASRGGMDIEGLGEAVVDQLVDKGRVKDFADVFGLAKEDLLELELFADKRAENLLAQIDRAKERPLSRLLYALGIRQVGERTARDLAARFKTLDAVAAASAADLERIKEIGPVVAAAVAGFFAQAPVARLLGRLKKAGLRAEEPERAPEAGAPLAGKTFVFTGELESMPRAEAEEKVRALGGQASSSVSKKTSYVVVGRDPGSKAEKAKKLGVPTLDEAAFLRMAR